MIIKIADQEFDPTQIVATEWSFAGMELLIALKDKRVIKIPEIEIARMGFNRWQDFIRQVEGSIPHSITFFANGTACVGNKFNQQMGQYQIGSHEDTIQALADDGFNWWELDVAGSPQRGGHDLQGVERTRNRHSKSSADLPQQEGGLDLVSNE